MANDLVNVTVPVADSESDIWWAWVDQNPVVKIQLDIDLHKKRKSMREQERDHHYRLYMEAKEAAEQETNYIEDQEKAQAALFGSSFKRFKHKLAIVA